MQTYLEDLKKASTTLSPYSQDKHIFIEEINSCEILVLAAVRTFFWALHASQVGVKTQNVELTAAGTCNVFVFWKYGGYKTACALQCLTLRPLLVRDLTFHHSTSRVIHRVLEDWSITSQNTN
jgi:hypothetical protein